MKTETAPKTQIGTCHFVGFGSAVKYYLPYGFLPTDVRRKIADGEIALGRPALKEGQTCFVNNEGRYIIEI